MLKKEIYLFDGKKSILVDSELYNCYERYADEFSERKVQYLSVVLGLTEDMTEKELSEKFSRAMYEDIYMVTAMEEELIAAMGEMIAEEKEEVKVVEKKQEMNYETKELINDKKAVCLTIEACSDSYIEKERIERCLAGLYKNIRYSEYPLRLGKETDNDIIRKIQVVIEKERFPEIMILVTNFVQEIFRIDEWEKLIKIS
ncbi:MAG: hypothetical protein IKU39_04635 [Lachnospiraceae bacterium]|nr:hypothetical protein [Lachnospiraceae bacterium]